MASKKLIDVFNYSAVNFMVGYNLLGSTTVHVVQKGHNEKL